MIIARSIAPDSVPEQAYERAVARLVRDLGWAPSKAHIVLGEVAQAHGVFLDDVAEAILGARSVKRGLASALRTVTFDRRPRDQREKSAR